MARQQLRHLASSCWAACTTDPSKGKAHATVERLRFQPQHATVEAVTVVPHRGAVHRNTMASTRGVSSDLTRF